MNEAPALELSLSETVGGFTLAVGISVDHAALPPGAADLLSAERFETPPCDIPAEFHKALRAALLQALDSARLPLALVLDAAAYKQVLSKVNGEPATRASDVSAQSGEAQP